MVCLNVAIVGRNPAEKLMGALMAKLINVVYAVFQQLGYETVSRLRIERERAYSTVRVLGLRPLTRVSRVGATRFFERVKAK